MRLSTSRSIDRLRASDAALLSDPPGRRGSHPVHHRHLEFFLIRDRRRAVPSIRSSRCRPKSWPICRVPTAWISPSGRSTRATCAALVARRFRPLVQVQGFLGDGADRPGISRDARARDDRPRGLRSRSVFPSAPSPRFTSNSRGRLRQRCRWPCVGIAIPSFVVLPFLGLLFGIYLHWLPVAGWEPGSIRHLVLPVVALALPPLACIARLTRGSMLEVLSSPFIRTALAKGLPLRTVICAARLAARPAAGGELSGPRRRLHHDRLAGGRIDRRIARHRPIHGARRAQSGLHAGDGHGDHLFDRAHRHGPARRSAVRLARSARQVRHDERASWREAARRLRANPGGASSRSGVIAMLVALALIGPWFNPNGSETLDWSHVASDPAWRTRIGSARTGWGAICSRARSRARASRWPSAWWRAPSACGSGSAIGAVAGYVGGRTDHVMMRIIEILSGLPLIFFVIFLTVDLRPQRISAVLCRSARSDGSPWRASCAARP